MQETGGALNSFINGKQKETYNKNVVLEPVNIQTLEFITHSLEVLKQCKCHAVMQTCSHFAFKTHSEISRADVIQNIRSRAQHRLILSP